ncbi:MAG: diguanylate cyclase [Rhodocyclaceae bacterium]|nr:diguanylate cyclase [Rhodocyclaceae bacterium]MBX3668625.1 diguanylate cyclase [Rhodocyclaceae bacterium]
MADCSQPSDVAREALRRLAVRKIPPTPDNYRSLYHEISGTPATDAFPERALKHVAASLPRATPEQLEAANMLEAAVRTRSWPEFAAVLRELTQRKIERTRNWGHLLRELTSAVAAGDTAARVAELDALVLACGGEGDQLYPRLLGTLRTWNNDPAASTSAGADGDKFSGGHFADLRDALADLLERVLGELLEDVPELHGHALRLARAVREAQRPQDIAERRGEFRELAYRVQWVSAERRELQDTLQSVLRLIVQNVAELVGDDQWLHGQMAMLGDLLSRPLTQQHLEDVERRLKDVVLKQSALRDNLKEAKDNIKAMLEGFIAHLSSFTLSTAGYSDKLGGFAQRIGRAENVDALAELVQEVLGETRAMQISAQNSHDEMLEKQQRVDQAEREIARLQRELAEASAMVRHDQLTGALNRKGLDETFEREQQRSARRGAPLCVAVIDLDNFKRLNDTYGHRAGDAALVHLSQTVRECLRPQDVLARYGGEEFVILLPDTELDAAASVLVRLQRELTRRLFLANNERILITFSAGVTPVAAAEDRNAALERADAAMYRAKQAGRNRVETSPLPA